MDEKKKAAAAPDDQQADFAAREAAFLKRLEDMEAAALASTQKKVDDLLAAAQEKAETAAQSQKTAAAPDAQAEERERMRQYMNERVTIKLFKDSREYKDDVFVSVNGIAYQIQRGVEVQVPRFVAQVLDQSMAQDESTARLIEKLEDDFARESERRGL